MGLMMRRRRPIARLAVGGAVAGAAYHAGKGRGQQDAVNEQATEAYDDTQAAPQYAPPPPAPAPAPPAPSDSAEQIEKLAELHTSGALTDEEFTAAKAKLLGL